MIEVFIIAGVVVATGVFIILSSANESIVIKQQKISLAKEKLNIAEKKYMQGKIKEKIFEKLKYDLQYEIVSNKLSIIKIKKEEASIKPKLKKILNKLKRKTKHKKVTLNRLLTQVDVVKKQLSVLDSMFMKRAITEDVYNAVAEEKENQLISLEADILKIVKEN